MKQPARNVAIFDWVAMLEDTEFTDQIYQIALVHLGGDPAGFEPTWKRFLVQFQQWSTLSPAQNTSGLNVKLEFLQMLLKQLPQLSTLRTDPRVIDLVLADTGCRMVGDKVVHPRFGECEITQRSIGDRFGVLYTIKTPDGSLVSFEFSTEAFKAFGNNFYKPLTVLWQHAITPWMGREPPERKSDNSR